MLVLLLFFLRRSRRKFLNSKSFVYVPLPRPCFLVIFLDHTHIVTPEEWLNSFYQRSVLKFLQQYICSWVLNQTAQDHNVGWCKKRNKEKHEHASTHKQINNINRTKNKKHCNLQKYTCQYWKVPEVQDLRWLWPPAKHKILHSAQKQ